MMDPKSQTNRPKPKKRVSGVSHRKELAVVTLATVASIAGVGGLLSMQQSVSHVAQPTQTTGTAANSAGVAPARPEGTGAKPVRFVPSSWHGDEGREIDDDGGAIVQAAKANHRNAAPFFSAHAHRSPSAVSQGSPP